LISKFVIVIVKNNTINCKLCR